MYIDNFFFIRRERTIECYHWMRENEVLVSSRNDSSWAQSHATTTIYEYLYKCKMRKKGRKKIEFFYHSGFWILQTLIKTLANEDTLLRTHCRSGCFLGCANWEIFVADSKCFWTKSETFFVSRTQNLCPQQLLRARANGETFVSATMCPQQCVLVC